MSNSNNKKTILVVDDNTEYLSILQELLFEN